MSTECLECKKVQAYNRMIVLARSQRMMVRGNKCKACKAEEKSRGNKESK